MVARIPVPVMARIVAEPVAAKRDPGHLADRLRCPGRIRHHRIGGQVQVTVPQFDRGLRRDRSQHARRVRSPLQHGHLPLAIRPAEVLGDVDPAGPAGHRQPCRTDEPGRDHFDVSGVRVDPVHRAARAQARILRAARQRRHVEPAIGAEFDVRRHRLEPVLVVRSAGRQADGGGDLSGDQDRVSGRHHCHGGHGSAVVDAQDGVAPASATYTASESARLA